MKDGTIRPADDGDHHEPRAERQPEAVALRRVVAARGLPVEDEVACGEDREHAENDQVAPVPTRHDLAPDDGGQRDRKGEVDGRDGGGRQRRRRRHRDASGKPERRERAERPAHDRQPPRPVRDRRQEEARDHGTQVAEEELMRMPAHRIEGGGQDDAGP